MPKVSKEHLREDRRQSRKIKKEAKDIISLSDDLMERDKKIKRKKKKK